MTDAPVILVVVDDPDLRHDLGALLSRRFGSDYRIVATDGRGAAGHLTGLAEAGERLAVVISQPELTGTTGLDVLAMTHDLHRHARRVLLVARGEWHSDHPVRQAIVLGAVDSYLFVPWGPREQWLYAPMTETLAMWWLTQPAEYEAARIVGRSEPRAEALRDLLGRVMVPFGFYEADSEGGRAVLDELGLDGSALPVLHFTNSGAVLTAPSDRQLLAALGFRSEPVEVECDVAIVGGGPSGLSAAVSASSEGLRTVLIDDGVIGGQAGSSSMIRNYLGFPRGLSGGELTNRALEQVWLFGADVLTPQRAVSLEADGVSRILHTEDGSRIAARCVILATGVSW